MKSLKSPFVFFIAFLIIGSLACSIILTSPSATQIPIIPQPINPPQQSQPDQPTYTPAPTYTAAPTYTPAATFTPQPTYTEAPTQVLEAQFTPNQPVFCRSGPSEQVWWDPLEALNEGQTVKIVGKSSAEWGLWWYIQKASGVRCWVYSELGSTSGNVAGVPEKSSPATPTPSIINIYFKNNRAFSICDLWIEDEGAGNWIDLIDGWELFPEQTLTFYIYHPGNYDIEIYACDGTLVDVAYGFYLGPDSTRFSTSP